MRKKRITTAERSSAKPRTIRTERKGSASRAPQSRDSLPEKRFRDVFDALPISIWEEDFSEVRKALMQLREQGVTDFRKYLGEHPEFVMNAARMVKVVDVNAMTLRLFEATDKSELLGSLETRLLPEALVDFCDELVAIAEGRLFFEGEVTDRTLRGKTIHLWRTIVFPREDEKFKSVMVSLTDMTERKHTEMALRESEARLLTVLEASPIPITLNSLADGIILYGNSSLANLLGVPLSEVIGQKAENFYADPRDRLKLLGELEHTGLLRDYEVLLRRPSGMEFWVSLSSEEILLEGQPCVLSCLYDITERKRSEQVLRQFRNLMDQSNDAIFLIEPESGGYIDFNQTALDRLGYTREELSQRNITDVAGHISNLDEWDQRLRLVRDQGGLIFDTDYKRKDGTTFPVEVSARMVEYGGRTVVLAIVRDINDRKRAEALQAAIYQISEAANNAISMDDLFRSVHTIIGQVMPAQNFYIALYDEASEVLSFPYYVDEVDGSASIPATQPGRGMTEYILRTGKALLSDAANFEELARTGEVELVGPPSPIWVGAPLIVEGRTIGVIALQDYHNPEVYSERELRMLEFVSGQVAKAIERTRLYEDIRRSNRILTALQEATLPLIKQTELSEVLQEILKQAIELFETMDGYIYLLKPDESELVLSMGMGPSSHYIGTRLQIGEGLAGKAWETGKPMSVDDYDTWHGKLNIFSDDLKFHASAAVPLMAKSKIMGVLGIGDVTPGRKFDQDDLELMTRFAELASIAIENARLYTLSQQELHERKMAEEALREAEAKYRTVVEHISAITYTALMDEAKTLLYVSPQIETLLGYTPEEYLSDPEAWRNTIHPQDRERVLTEAKRFYETGEPLATDYRSVARDGRIVWFHDEAVIFEDHSTHKRFIQGIKVDISQRVQAEALQNAIYRISDAASLSGGMQDFYRAIHESLRRVMFADNFFIALYEKETDLLRFPYYVDENDTPPHTAPLGRGPTAYVIRYGMPLFGKSETMRQLEAEGVLEPAGTRSIDWLGVPLKIENETIGAMAVQTYTAGIRYSQRDLEILKFVSTQVALSIERKQSAENLRAAEARYRSLIEQLPMVVYVNPADDVSATVYVSPQIKDFLGYSQEEWLKDPLFWQKALHPEDRARVIAEVQKMKGEIDSFDEEYRMIARDGSVVWVRDQATLLNDLEGRPLLWQGLMLDISDRKQSEGRIKLQIERLKALRTIDMFIASGTDLHLTLQTILQQAVSQLGVDAADIFLLNPSMHVLEFSEGIGFRTRGIEQTTLRVGEGFAGRAVLQREMISVEDLSSYDKHPLFVLEGFITCHFIPLIAKGEVKGVLEVFNRSLIDSDDEWMDFLESLAGQAALAVDNASLFESLQRTNIELSLAYETTLEGWSAALDLRDKETEGHTQRVTDLTLKLAKAMGVGEKERVHIRRGALLHDIGKMGIPDRILLKPDVLTGEEWEIMRQHPVYAYNLLSQIAHLRPALDIPYCHHERWDGSGYPRGLKAEAIPLAARIFAVADVWDALCSDRPYRPAWSREQALGYIKSLSSVHFDPQVVEVFLQVIQDE
ncbi:MAG: PAS domain S-box protein [Chloroflexota bacterium]